MKDYRQKIISTLNLGSLPPPQLAGHEPHRQERGAAAVLIPIIEKDGPHIVLTRRADHLSSHPGQVSFPGGHWEKDDPDLVFTALREAQEEIGLDPALVEISGILPTQHSGKGQPMVPVVGFVAPGAALQPNADEVADIFSAPLSFLMDFNNYQHHQHKGQDRVWNYYSTHWEGFEIWGATANILRSFYDKVFKDS